ncbi:E3 SUMO-protein ligase NSE2 [Spea bombifrons]|uniref:E3 SUMO-protein ligase NSE2 n=1 Tax=Spea bombifrons TaxID=233779 RepID=UPI00234A14E1|nr:E3 SUMO-protein ligase NSE2 [Spea bombifrons]
MQGRSAPFISFTSVDNSISSLKNCQAYINTGMEITTNVALDLLETGCNSTDVNSMESVMLEYAAMDRDVNQYITAVEEITRQLKRDPPETIPDLTALVREKYAAIQSKNAVDDLKKCGRFLQFKDQVREMRKQYGVSQDGTEEEMFESMDDDVTVTQSQANFVCPITLVEMTNPVKNKVCGHTYQREAIERMIQDRQQKKKNTRCPKIGCDHSDIKITDLVPDVALKRTIETHHKQKSHR